MLVKDVMTHGVTWIGPEMLFKEIVALLVERNITGVPVVDRDELVGIVTESDLIAKAAYPHEEHRGTLSVLASVLSGREGAIQKADGLRAREIMTTSVVTAEPREQISTAVRRMLERGVRRLPVVEEGRLVGIVSRRDVLALFDKSDHALEVAVTDLLQCALYVPPEHKITVTVIDGMVSLTGHVYLKRDIHVVARIIAAYPGVVGIRNFLDYRYEDPPGAAL